ncbi:MAG: hypothetical protein C0626_01230 [Arcobacter sp.]|nr:MAG: hypothetical protein C0626_01230 [Arcobacter sp.]
MLVSTNTQLNILVANKTSNAVKEVLKEADVKTLTSQNKDFNVSTLLKTLFNNVQNSTKSNETVLNLLKNSNLSKDLGSFTSNLQSLVKALPDDKSTQELKTFLQKFSITPDQATPKNVEGQIQKSGIFLESKLLNQVNNPDSKNQNSLLNDMKAVLLKTKAQLETIISNQSKNPTPQKAEVAQNNAQVTQNVSKENINTTETLKQIDKLLTQLKSLDTSNIKEQVTKPNINSEAKPTQQATPAQTIKPDSPLINDIKTLLSKVQAQLQNQVANQTQTPQKAEVAQNNAQVTQERVQTQSTSQLLQMRVDLKTENQTQTLTKETINNNETLKQIDKLLSQLKNLDTSKAKESSLKAPVTQDVKTAIQPNMQAIRSDSPIFNDIKTLLSKVQTQIKTQIGSQAQEELKALSSKESDPAETLKQVDKLLTQIDYHQLYSIANSSNNVYIPFLWDLLEDGSIDIKKIDEEKFYCLIDLTLKDLGKINLHLYLYEDDKLDISIFVEKDDTKQLIRQKATALKRELNGTAISVIGLNVYTLKEDSKENIYTQNDNFDFGVNIKV